MKKLLFVLLITNHSLLTVNAQWVHVNNGMGYVSVRPLASSGNNLFAGTDSGVYLSTDNGTSWTQTSLNNVSVLSFAINGNNLFAGALSSGVYLSTDNGTSWTQTSLNNQGVRSLLVNGNNIFAGSWAGNGVYLSTDNGATWTQTSLTNQYVYSFAVSGNTIFAATWDTGIFLSTDNGTSWTQTLNYAQVLSVAVSGNNILAGAVYTGVYLSTNNGATWAQTSLNNRTVMSLAVNGNNIFAGTYYGYGVYVSNDNGASWTQRNEGMGSGYVRSLCILDNYIFAAAISEGVWRRQIGELIGIQTISNEAPNKFSLSQNYPNPFNPTTKIKFDVPQFPLNKGGERGLLTRLTIYDILGREVETLVNEQLKPGSYEINWNASNFSSGIYYYKLTAGDFVETKKMVVLK